MTARKHTSEELKRDLNVLKTVLIALQNPKYLAKLKAKAKATHQQITEIREDAQRQKRTTIIFTNSSIEKVDKTPIRRHFKNWLEFIE